jgi:ubiquinone/menaquinone biosynthesis C-methylase UbiE
VNTDIHDLAARGFERAGDDYERGRPGYPAEAIDFVVRELEIRPGTRVLDLAAGTGKLTRQLVPTGAELVAVEPVAGMRRKLVDAAPGVEALAGTAEAIPLADASVDTVVCAQAFHWFDGDRALAEIHRVLRPGGSLALIWNVRDETVEWERQVSELLKRHQANAPRKRWGRWREAFERTELFTALRERKFVHEQEGDVDTMLARVASISFVSALPDDERARFLGEVRSLVEPYGSPLVMHYRTEVYWARRRA